MASLNSKRIDSSLPLLSVACWGTCVSFDADDCTANPSHMFKVAVCSALLNVFAELVEAHPDAVSPIVWLPTVELWVQVFPGAEGPQLPWSGLVSLVNVQLKVACAGDAIIAAKTAAIERALLFCEIFIFPPENQVNDISKQLLEIV